MVAKISFRGLMCAAVLLGAAGVQAQDRFDIEELDSVTSPAGSVLSVYGGRALEAGSYAVTLQGSYGRKPLSLESPAGASLGDLVGSVGTLQLLGAVGVYKRLEVGVGIPVHRNSAGSPFETQPPPGVQAATLSSSKVAFGDIRIVPRMSLFEHAGPAGFDLAALASVWLPTGSQANYAGESLRVEPRLALDYATRTWLVALNLGYMVRGAANVLGTELNDQLRAGAGASVDLGKHLTLLGEVDMNFNVLSNNFNSADIASEGLVGLRYNVGGLVAQVGGGPGIMRGMSAPVYRVLASVALEGALKKPIEDSDHDSLYDDVDQCVQQPEDRDDFEDQDGCPDPDNDNDGIADVSDRCPREAEDKDGFQDDDGCPDLDNDADGIADANDRCPTEAEDRDGFQDDDGCPDSDNDRDEIADADDKCPNEPGVIEAQGCPKAPEPEPPPPAAPAAAVVTKEKIELREMIHFGNNNAEIQADSFGLVDTIAKLMTEHTEIQHIVIEGHTDSRGKAAHNQKLSDARAASVMQALVLRGVQAMRMSSVGFGPTKPVAPNDTDENRAKNRRVELRIDKRDASKD